MASPQTKNGYTRIANELLEVLPRTNISSQEYKILLVVLRKTYGFHKKSDFISISQFKKLTGIYNTGRISQLTKSLEKKNILKINRTAGKTNQYSFNKDYENWNCLDQKDIDLLTQVKGYTLNKLKRYLLTGAKQPFNLSASTKEIDQKKRKDITVISNSEIKSIWNKSKATKNIRKITDSRKQQISNLWESDILVTKTDWQELIKQIEASKYLQNKKWFNFDWIIKDENNAVKVLEGKYQDKPDGTRSDNQFRKGY